MGAMGMGADDVAVENREPNAQDRIEAWCQGQDLQEGFIDYHIISKKAAPDSGPSR